MTKIVRASPNVHKNVFTTSSVLLSPIFASLSLYIRRPLALQRDPADHAAQSALTTKAALTSGLTKTALTKSRQSGCKRIYCKRRTPEVTGGQCGEVAGEVPACLLLSQIIYIMPPPARVCAACKATKSRCDNFGLGLTCDRCTRLGLRCEPAPPLAHMPRTRDFADPKGQAAPAPGRSVPANSTCKDRLGADHRMSIAPRCALASNCMSWKGTMSWNGGVVPFFHERNITHERHINIEVISQSAKAGLDPSHPWVIALPSHASC